MLRRYVFLAVTMALFGQRPVEAQPALSHMVPAGVQPGQTTEVTFHGTKLDGELRVWSSFPANFEWAPVEAGKKDVTSRSCKVTVPSEPVGVGGLVVANAEGNSEVLLCLVDDLPSLAEATDNQTLEKGQAVTLPVAIDGESNGALSDFFRFSAKKDQRISVEVVATRLGQPLDAVVRLLNAKGDELLLADDDLSYGADSRFAYTIPADGDYVLEIRDNQFRAKARYRLRVGDFPLVSAPHPLGGRAGSTMRFQFTGPLADTAIPVFLRVPDVTTAGQLAIAAKFPGGKSSAMATIVTSSLPDLVEVEPNNDRAAATVTSLPCALNGTLDQPADGDYYEFAATKGQSFQFRAISRSMGSPTYVDMRVLDAEGKQLAESPINDTDEATLAFTFPADGMYQLMVTDLLGRGGPEYGYRVEAEPNLGFSLNLKHDNNARTRFLLPRNGGSCSLTFQVARRGFEGPIQLRLEGAPAGYVLVNPQVPEKAKEHRVFLVVPDQAQAGELVAFRIAGSATAQGQELSATALTLPTLRAKLSHMAFFPGWLDGLLVASVTSDTPPPFELASSASLVAFSKAQGQAQFTVTLKRTGEGFKDAVSLEVTGLPSGFSAAVKPDKDTYQVTITGPKDAGAGRHAIRLQGYGELKGKGHMVSVALPLEVAD
ncbi:MAG: hypothetical protein AB7O38_13680 [Pirellulaceae bacterium]